MSFRDSTISPTFLTLAQPKHVVELGCCVLVIIGSEVGIKGVSLFEVEEVPHGVYLFSVGPDKEVQINVIISSACLAASGICRELSRELVEDVDDRHRLRALGRLVKRMKLL